MAFLSVLASQCFLHWMAISLVQTSSPVLRACPWHTILCAYHHYGAHSIDLYFLVLMTVFPLKLGDPWSVDYDLNHLVILMLKGVHSRDLVDLLSWVKETKRMRKGKKREGGKKEREKKQERKKCCEIILVSTFFTWESAKRNNIQFKLRSNNLLLNL